MANPEHLEILDQGVSVWNKWKLERRRDHLRRPDLSFAQLQQRDLQEVDFRGVNLMFVALQDCDLRRARLGGAWLTGANLQADLRLANFRDADLNRANLSGADLRAADFFHANLDDADLSGAELIGADFREALFGKSNLSGAHICDAVFSNNDLSAVVGLETVHHSGPSIISVDTVYRSQGRVPEAFLRGAGIPEDFIVYMRSLVGSPIEFYSCFISYSATDKEFADRLHADLQGKGVRCWFAPHDVQAGRKLHEQIDQAIRVHEKLLLILSPGSMNSEWVKTEIAQARKREIREKRQVLFPLRLSSFEVLRDWECFDADTGKDSAREIREYFIPDFSQWKDHDSYQEAFERLLNDLKAEKINAKTS